VGGAVLSCAIDDSNFGISSFCEHDLVIGLQPQQENVAYSKLGEHYETGPDQLSSIFSSESSTSTTTKLSELKILAGCYNDEEEFLIQGKCWTASNSPIIPFKKVFTSTSEYVFFLILP
jgi:hypothetical protein